jgi:uncharacterized repeat protein (TIGR01451 family)
MSARPRSRLLTLALSLGLLVAGLLLPRSLPPSHSLAPLAAGLDADRSGAGRSLPGIHRTIRKADHFGVSRSLRQIAAEQQPRQGDRKLKPDFEPERELKPVRQGEPRGRDPVLQAKAGPALVPPPNNTFEGGKNDDNFPFFVLPPDTNGEIGPNHYVQMINLVTEVFDRQGNLLLGPINSNEIWTGTPVCGTFNEGDPVVQYDQLADRWLLTQFAFARDLVGTGLPVGPYFECLAVSETADPTGSYFIYEFKVHDTKINDYPKFGVWPDAWYASFNMFDQTQLFEFSGPGAAAFERDKMLDGDPNARMVFFDVADTSHGGQLPSDVDGTTPAPAGAPNYFTEFNDDAFGFSTDQLSIFEFHVDWTNTANSTFAVASVVPVAAFDSNLCNFERNCVPQPHPGVSLDAISDRVMNRAAYRNFGDHESVMLNHTVDADGTDHAGIRWYELRDPGGAPSIFQQGTYAPDSEHRWMGSIAMDKAGDVALGYSLSSRSRFPSIAYTGRLTNDPLGQMPQGQGIMFPGGGAQTDDSGRWGDYSNISIDPTDDCTFWYTTEYYPVTDGFLWHTRIGSFTFPNCLGGGADLSLTKADSPDPVLVGNQVTYTLNAANNGPSGSSAATVTDTLPSGTTFVSATTTQGSCSQAGGTVTCSLGGMAAGASATITIKVNAPTSPALMTNRAAISGPENDPNPGNNDPWATTDVQNPCTTPGVHVAGDASDDPPNNPPVPEVDIKDLYVAEPVQGDSVPRLVFTLQVAKGSTIPPSSQWYILWNRPNPDASFDRNYVAMKSDPAALLHFEYGRISPPSVNLPTKFGDADSGSYDLAAGTITISIATSKIDNVGPGSVLGALQARTFFSRADGQPVTQLQSSDFGDIGSYTMFGNDACRTDADLSVSKTDAPDPIKTGQQLTYTIMVTNNGPSTAASVKATDTLPKTAGLISTTSTQGTCTAKKGTVTCTVGNMASGAKVTITIVVKPTKKGTLINTVTVTSTTSDPNTANNTATAQTRVT